jgi:phosphoribosylaminoimidazole-succinocarboxamide synthase
MPLMSAELESAPGLTLLSKGKVRDIYALDSNPELLLLVTTDRISVYDIVLSNVRSKKKTFSRTSLIISDREFQTEARY